MGSPCRAFERVGSTNDLALAWAREGAPHGALVIADEQSAGRGRRGRRWDGGQRASVLASFVLHLRTPAERLGLVGGAVAVAAARAVRTITGLPARTKWPNDLWIRNEKFGGILLETFRSDQGAQGVVAGIGVNVNQRRADLPPDARTPATSLALETGRLWDRAEILARLADELSLVLELLERRPDRLISEWTNLEWTLGREIVAAEGSRSVRGTATGLLSDGGLRLCVGESDRVLRWGEVTLAPEDRRIVPVISGSREGENSN